MNKYMIQDKNIPEITLGIFNTRKAAKDMAVFITKQEPKLSFKIIKILPLSKESIDYFEMRFGIYPFYLG